jgi:SAM-dependent methyltransferase
MTARAVPEKLPGKRMALVAVAGAAAAAVWWWTDTAPYPYALHKLLDLPLPFLTNRRLDALLSAKPGERVLEVGPGTGLQALHVAGLLGADGRLDVVDIQQPMLDHVAHRAAVRKIGSVFPTRADARKLPFDDGSFDAAYLVTVLGEIPNPGAALREIRRVLKPGGRLGRRRVPGPSLRPAGDLARVRQRCRAAAVGVARAAVGILRKVSGVFE